MLMFTTLLPWGLPDLCIVQSATFAQHTQFSERARMHELCRITLQPSCGCMLCVTVLLLQLGRLPENVMAQITSKLLQGLLFMHSRHIVSWHAETDRQCG